MKKVRIDRLLANLGYGSRTEVQRLLRSKEVVFNGNIINDPSSKLEMNFELQNSLLVSGEKLEPFAGFVVMMNKPLGYTCSHKEEGDLVYDLLPPRWNQRNPKFSSIGRLDKETSGLLLFTDDGNLLHQLGSSKKIPKKYLAKLDRPLSGKEKEIFASGKLILESEEKPLLPANLEVISDREAFLTIYEGRYHQVRRMFAAVGNHVTALSRKKFGNLELGSLAECEFRILDENEMKSLKTS